MSKVYRLFALVLVAAFVLSACAPAAAPAPAQPAPAQAEPTKAPAAAEPTKAPAAAEPTKAPAAAPAATKAPEPTKATAPAAAAAGQEYHGAFPYQVPPKGHLNSFVTDGIPNGISIYQDLLELPGARYYWADNKWLPLVAGKLANAAARQVRYEGASWPDLVRRQAGHLQGCGGDLQHPAHAQEYYLQVR